MYRATYETREEIPERVADLYEETADGWRFAAPELLEGDEVPEALVRRIEERADARVSAATVELEEFEGTLASVRAEAAEARADVERSRIAEAIRDAGRAEGLKPEALEDATLAAAAEGLALEGDRVLTRDGRSVREWLIDKRPTRRHWFAPKLAPRTR